MLCAEKKTCFTVSECNYVTSYHLHLLYCLLNYLVVTWGYVVTGFRGTTAYILAMRDSGLVAFSNITREPTCSWCNRPLTLPRLLEYGTGQWGLNPTVYQHTQSDIHTHIVVDKLCLIRSDIHYIRTHMLYTYTIRIHTPFWKFQRLKASATLNMGVYYMAGMQERRLLLHFCSSLIPLLLSLNVT